MEMASLASFATGPVGTPAWLKLGRFIFILSFFLALACQEVHLHAALSLVVRCIDEPFSDRVPRIVDF